MANWQVWFDIFWIGVCSMCLASMPFDKNNQDLRCCRYPYTRKLIGRYSLYISDQLGGRIFVYRVFAVFLYILFSSHILMSLLFSYISPREYMPLLYFGNFFTKGEPMPSRSAPSLP